MAAHQAPLSLGFSRQEHWSGLPFLQCMKVKSESEVTRSCSTVPDPMDCSQTGSSVPAIFQARVLEWSAIAFSMSFHNAQLFIMSYIILLLTLNILFRSVRVFLQASVFPLVNHIKKKKKSTWHQFVLTAPRTNRTRNGSNVVSENWDLVPLAFPTQQSLTDAKAACPAQKQTSASPSPLLGGWLDNL